MKRRNFLKTTGLASAALALDPLKNVKANAEVSYFGINSIIENSKSKKLKSICFVTGVPGAGKTLAGLNIAVERLKTDENEHAVFLSGNGPLVYVLREALTRDEVSTSKLLGKKLR